MSMVTLSITQFKIVPLHSIAPYQTTLLTHFVIRQNTFGDSLEIILDINFNELLLRYFGNFLIINFFYFSANLLQNGRRKKM